MRKAARLAVALFPMCGLALSACGGGGGGDEDRYSGVAFRAADVNGSSAIMITGGSPPEASSAQVMSEQNEIMSRSNLRHHIVLGVNAEGYVSRTGALSRELDCGPDTCFAFHGSDVIEPIMTRNGIQLFRASVDAIDEDYGGNPTEVVILEYGGWMDHSLFRVEVRPETYAGGSSVIEVSGWGFAFGDAPKTNPDTGPFAWNGVMVGRNSDIDSSQVSNVVQGDAAVSAELFQEGDMSVDVTFSNIKDLNSGSSLADIAWTDLSVVDGTFESSTIAGSFFGPQHEEVAGVFEESNVLGAFGARR